MRTKNAGSSFGSVPPRLGSNAYQRRTSSMFGDIVPRSMFEDAIDQGLHTDRLEDLPGLDVVAHFHQFPGATDTALRTLSRADPS